MRQTITFNDHRIFTNDEQNISLEILAPGLSGRVCMSQTETGSSKSGCTSFTVDITDVPKEQKANTVTITLDRADGKQKICTLSHEDDGEYAANWFDHIETVASDAPMEYSEKHFSVCDTLDDIMADHNAFQILANAMYSMSGMKLTRSMLAEMGGKTPLELASMLDPAEGSGAGMKTPENAMQIINAELNKITKK